jgi:hypothetical protein
LILIVVKVLNQAYFKKHKIENIINFIYRYYKKDVNLEFINKLNQELRIYIHILGLFIMLYCDEKITNNSDNVKIYMEFKRRMGIKILSTEDVLENFYNFISFPEHKNLLFNLNSSYKFPLKDYDIYKSEIISNLKNILIKTRPRGTNNRRGYRTIASSNYIEGYTNSKLINNKIKTKNKNLKNNININRK